MISPCRIQYDPDEAEASNLDVTVDLVFGEVSELNPVVDRVVGQVVEAGPSVYKTSRSNSKIPLEGEVSVIGPICLIDDKLVLVLSPAASINPELATVPPA